VNPKNVARAPYDRELRRFRRAQAIQGEEEMSPKHWRWISALVVGGLLMAACAGPQEATEAPAGEEPAAPVPTIAPAPPAEKKVATFIFTEEFDTLNPYYTNMWFSEITHQLWNVWPWQFDDTNAVYPVMLTEMPTVENGGITEEGRVLTLSLRDDLTWSDGEPLTAQDFVFTYEMIVDPNNAVASAYPYDEAVASVEAPDDLTVVVTFNEAFIPWASSLWQGLLPEHILRPVYEAEGTIDNAEWNHAPTVGSGPYVFAEWESGSFTRFEANENYWLGRPALDEIFIRFVPDDASQVNALVAGDGDLGTFFDYSDVPTLKDAGVDVFAAQSGYNEGWFFYLGEESHPALQDKRVRQAIAMGFDRASLSQDLLLGLTKPAATYWDNTPYADPAVEPWPYDPLAAATLLDDAGWIDSNGDGTRDKDGVELVLSYGTTTREIRQDTVGVPARSTTTRTCSAPHGGRSGCHRRAGHHAVLRHHQFPRPGHLLLVVQRDPLSGVPRRRQLASAVRRRTGCPVPAGDLAGRPGRAAADLPSNQPHDVRAGLLVGDVAGSRPVGHQRTAEQRQDQRHDAVLQHRRVGPAVLS
jgi:ABC-type transport system substrate-binding protein